MIRTLDTLPGMPVFKTGAINRSATSPAGLALLYLQAVSRSASPGAVSARSSRISCHHEQITSNSGAKPLPKPHSRGAVRWLAKLRIRKLWRVWARIVRAPPAIGAPK